MNIKKIFISNRDLNFLSKRNQEKIIEIFHNDGCLIIEFLRHERDNDQPQIRNFILKLKNIFGNIVPHEHSDFEGIVSISPNLSHPDYINTTSDFQLPHTDGAFEIEPPKVVVLQCEKSCQFGGETILVKAEDLYENLVKTLKQSQVLNLFEENSFRFNRGDKSCCRSIFECIDLRIQFFFRFSKQFDFAQNCNEKVEQGYQEILRYVSQKENQTKFKLMESQILILDNTRFLHGRYSFEEFRKLNRLWFQPPFGNPRGLKFGFVPSSEVGVKILNLCQKLNTDQLTTTSFIKDYTYWYWTLRYNPGEYLGASIFWLKRNNSGSLATLQTKELLELQMIIELYESMTCKIFKPDRFNYFQLGNENNQLHIHAIPRYMEKRIFETIEFHDKKWGENPFPINKNKNLSLKVLERIRLLYQSNDLEIKSL